MEVQTTEEEAIDIESRDQIRPMMTAEEATTARIDKVSQMKVETIADTRVRMIIEDRIETIIRIQDQALSKVTTRKRNITITKAAIKAVVTKVVATKVETVEDIKAAKVIETKEDTKVDRNQAIKEETVEDIKAAKVIETKEDTKVVKEDIKVAKVKEGTIRRKIMMRILRRAVIRRRRQRKANPEEMMCIKAITGPSDQKKAKTEGNTIIVRSINRIVAGARRLSMFQRISRDLFRRVYE